MASESEQLVSESSGLGQSRPEELPPVTPPSAGFIVQLFLIPALIVMAVVAVWALFGQLAHTENDWTHLTADISSKNELRRWPAAEGLAHLLHNEQISPPLDREPLAKNPVVVDSLTKLFTESLATNSTDDETIRQQEFLARTMGALNADEKTLPVLAEAMKDSHDPVVRKSALMAVSLIAGRHFDDATGYSEAIAAGTIAPSLTERNLPLATATISDAATLEQLRRSAQDPDPVIRHLAAYAMASVSGPESLQQLRSMLGDSNRLAQANAAIGLARNGSIDGVATMMQLMTDSMKPHNHVASPTEETKLTPEEMRQAEVRHEIEETQVASNCLRAVGDLWPQISTSDKTALLSLMRDMEQNFFASNVRQQAAALLKTIGQPE